MVRLYCKKCGLPFYEDTTTPKRCQDCRTSDKTRAKRKYTTNTEYREERKEQIRAYQHEHRAEETARQTKYQNQLYQEDINYRLRKVLRCRLNSALKDEARAGSAVQDLGCTIPELKAHIEGLWQPGMTWENWTTDGWHIDHIHPLVSFDLTNREQFLQACHYTNLQPLWANENLEKGPS